MRFTAIVFGLFVQLFYLISSPSKSDLSANNIKVDFFPTPSTTSIHLVWINQKKASHLLPDAILPFTHPLNKSIRPAINPWKRLRDWHTQTVCSVTLWVDGVM